MKVQASLLCLAIAAVIAPATADAATSAKSAVVARANALIGNQAAAMRKNTLDAFVASDVSVDANGTEHVRYQRSWRGMPVIGVVSLEHCLASPARHSSGKRLPDIADITIDNCTPAGDALVSVEGLPYPVGPGSQIGYAVIVNALKCLVAAELTRRGQPPLVLTSGVLIGSEASAKLFDQTYDDYRARVAPLYGPPLRHTED